MQGMVRDRRASGTYHSPWSRQTAVAMEGFEGSFMVGEFQDSGETAAGPPDKHRFAPAPVFSHRKIKKINTKLILSYYNVLLDKKAQLT